MSTDIATTRIAQLEKLGFYYEEDYDEYRMPGSNSVINRQQFNELAETEWNELLNEIANELFD